MPVRARRFIAAVCVLLAAGAVLAAAPPRARALTVAAAASLQTALRDVEQAWQGAGHAPLTLVFGASGSLARQIENGAPYDVFASANAAWVEGLRRKGLIAEGSVVSYAEGQLALAVADARLLAGQAEPLDAAALRLLRNPDVRVIALANPELAPYGAAAREALQRAGLWADLKPRLVYGDNVRQTLTYVDTYNAEAGLVAASLLVGTQRTWRRIDPALHAPIRQVLGIVADSPRPDAARRFTQFLLGKRGQAILQGHGLGPPRP